ncbi:hypothetical protein GCM10020331_053150 [Ectobacillus funiculus]
MALTHNLTSTNQKWLKLFFGMNAGKTVTLAAPNQAATQTVPYVKVQLKYPEINDELFLEQVR